MINQSGDFACFCLFLCLVVLVVSVYKRSGGVSCRFPHPLFPFLPPLLLDLANDVFPRLHFLPVFLQGGRLRPRRGGVDGTGRRSR